MQKKNQIEFKVSGKYALFSNPLNRISGEKFSYSVPTYEALKGVTKSIYFKPTLTWVVDEVRIMNQIQFSTQGIRPVIYQGGNSLSYYTYLIDVEYQIRAHFEWNFHHEELASDRNENKHYLIAKRMIERGGRRDVFLGTSECKAYVEPCKFGDGIGFYDDQNEELFLGSMVHGFIYPDEYVNEEEKEKLVTTFWSPTIKKGILTFIRPEHCTMRRIVGNGKIKKFDKGNYSGLHEFEEGGLMDELGE